MRLLSILWFPWLPFFISMSRFGRLAMMQPGCAWRSRDKCCTCREVFHPVLDCCVVQSWEDKLVPVLPLGTMPPPAQGSVTACSRLAENKGCLLGPGVKALGLCRVLKLFCRSPGQRVRGAAAGSLGRAVWQGQRQQTDKRTRMVFLKCSERGVCSRFLHL